jgi:hypothetical protein
MDAWSENSVGAGDFSAMLMRREAGWETLLTEASNLALLGRKVMLGGLLRVYFGVPGPCG